MTQPDRWWKSRAGRSWHIVKHGSSIPHLDVLYSLCGVRLGHLADVPHLERTPEWPDRPASRMCKFIDPASARRRPKEPTESSVESLPPRLPGTEAHHG